MIPEFLQKIKDWSLPKTGKEVARFLGFTRYYKTFIPQYSVLTKVQYSKVHTDWSLPVV